MNEIPKHGTQLKMNHARNDVMVGMKKVRETFVIRFFKYACVQFYFDLTSMLCCVMLCCIETQSHFI